MRRAECHVVLGFPLVHNTSYIKYSSLRLTPTTFTQALLGAGLEEDWDVSSRQMMVVGTTSFSAFACAALTLTTHGRHQSPWLRKGVLGHPAAMLPDLIPNASIVVLSSGELHEPTTHEPV